MERDQARDEIKRTVLLFLLAWSVAMLAVFLGPPPGMERLHWAWVIIGVTAVFSGVMIARVKKCTEDESTTKEK